MSILLLLFLATSCAPPLPPIDPGALDAGRAFAHVEKLVGFGPRPSGSDALRQSADYLVRELERCGLAVEIQEFRAGTPRGPIVFRNIVARTRSAGRRVIVLGSHYDTVWLPDIEMVGANDAGSSSGLLLELARVLADQPDLVFAWFDGEEAIGPYSDENGLWGSRYFVADLEAEGDISRVRAMILLDMVGDRDLTITLPSNGDPVLTEKALTAANRVGARHRFALRPSEVLDDHVPFLRAGIPAVDIIDFEFGSAPGRNDYWHTAEDTLDKISVDSLGVIGRVTLQLVADLRE